MKVLITSFIVIVAAQLFVPVKMIYNKQTSLIYGKSFTFRTQPIDPYDPFRGKYVVLNYSDNYIEIDSGEKWRRGETVFVEFEKGTDGFAKIKSIKKQRPVNTDIYLKSKITDVDYYHKRRVYVNYPFTRYYMEESKAETAELMVSDFSDDSRRMVSTVVRIYKGEASIKKLQVDKTRMEDAVEQHHSEHF